ncbi:hypothetical protein AKJ09_01136 [Labilithrix luteola]|uniref:Cytochrome c domain-containing protein n=1 Tax=Labilithrix luteola TaxID=1391654 RepID=A0A0K1PLS4_9BACT|nr:hypothetical protein [Labilithrix luteola]AKU94472.1 hypothetical protein AKJ09_01136 [Labilithrix luteola]
MVKIRVSTLTLGLAVALLGTLVLACSDDAADKLSGRATPGGRGNGGNGTSGTGSSGDPGGVNGSGLSPEETLFRALETDLSKKCGGVCHTDGTFTPTPPKFLEGPDAYKSIKAHPGIVTRDVYQSALLTKGPHAGPAVSADPDFEKKVIAWLEAESLAIQSQKLPSTDPVTVTQGANDIDLSKACVSGLAGVHLKFQASLVGGMLALEQMTIVAPAGTDVHIYKPKFVKILATPKADGSTDVYDPADSFSNTDQTVPGGQETGFATGSVLFSGDGFRPFDMATEKIRIEFEKLEPGKVAVLQGADTCKNPAGFAANVLPAMKGGGGFNLNCSGCHGNGLANLSLNSNDNALVCNQVLAKMTKGNIGGSLIVTKVTNGPHQGGIITDKTGWQSLFTNNAAVFF